MSLNFTRISFVPFHAALLAAAMIVPSAASAASPCKGLQADACSADAQCTWVNGYVRRMAGPVASHCKLKPSANNSAMLDDDALKLAQKIASALDRVRDPHPLSGGCFFCTVVIVQCHAQRDPIRRCIKIRLSLPSFSSLPALRYSPRSRCSHASRCWSPTSFSVPCSAPPHWGWCLIRS